MLTILHFADAHIDMANYGRHDPESGLPMRVVDFLKSLDTIVETAIAERVDLVLFAGDAYKDRSPAPTFQREWGRRIMRLARAGIPTLLLVGNHDVSPALNRAHALEAFDTLDVPNVHVLDKPCFLGPAELNGLPLQVLALPWVSRSGLMASQELSAAEPGAVYEALEERLTWLVQDWLAKADPSLPVVLTAHASVQGALFGGERTVMLGADLVLPGSLVRDERLAYVQPAQSGITDRLLAALPPAEQLAGAIVRLVLEYPRDWEALIDEAALREYAAETFEFHLVRRPKLEARVRLPENQSASSLTALELLDYYWGASHTDPAEQEALSRLAAEIINEEDPAT